MTYRISTNNGHYFWGLGANEIETSVNGYRYAVINKPIDSTLHAIAQITLFEAAANDCTWWTFTKLPPRPPPPPPPPPSAPLSTTPNTRSLSDVKLCTELYGDEGRPAAVVNPNAQRLAARRDETWPPGGTLSVSFIGGTTLVHERVRLSSIIHRSPHPHYHSFIRSKNTRLSGRSMRTSSLILSIVLGPTSVSVLIQEVDIGPVLAIPRSTLGRRKRP
jgi:hypothetical protein